MTIEVQIKFAVDSILYLPVKVAVEQGVFQQVALRADAARKSNGDASKSAPDAAGYDFKIILPKNKDDQGDIEAVQYALDVIKQKDAETIALALCDPFAIVEHAKTNDGSSYRTEDIRVFGAILKKPPFWTVGILGQGTGERTLYSLGKDFDTAWLIANRLKDKIAGKDGRISENSEDANWGDEWRNFNLAYKDFLVADKNIKSPILLTPDLLRLGLVMKAGDGESHMYANPKPVVETFDNFLTTALVTEKSVLEGHRHGIAALLEAIKISCIMLLMHRDFITDLCVESLKKGFSSTNQWEQIDVSDLPFIGSSGAAPNDNQIREAALWASKKIFDEHVFDTDLTIQKPEWDHMVRVRLEPKSGQQGMGPTNKEIEKFAKLYETVVDNEVEMALDIEMGAFYLPHLFRELKKRTLFGRGAKIVAVAAFAISACLLLIALPIQFSELLQPYLAPEFANLIVQAKAPLPNGNASTFVQNLYLTCFLICLAALVLNFIVAGLLTPRPLRKRATIIQRANAFWSRNRALCEISAIAFIGLACILANINASEEHKTLVTSITGIVVSIGPAIMAIMSRQKDVK